MINIGTNPILSAYQANSAKNTSSASNIKEKATSATVGDPYRVDISTAGKEASANNKSYDLAKVMQIHEKGFKQVPTKEESDYYWSARKSDPALDARLYEQDKAAALKEVADIQALLMKASLGQKLTPAEEKLVKNDPALQQEMQIRRSKTQMFM